MPRSTNVHLIFRNFSQSSIWRETIVLGVWPLFGFSCQIFFLACVKIILGFSLFRIFLKNYIYIYIFIYIYVYIYISIYICIYVCCDVCVLVCELAYACADSFMFIAAMRSNYHSLSHEAMRASDSTLSELLCPCGWSPALLKSV